MNEIDAIRTQIVAAEANLAEAATELAEAKTELAEAETAGDRKMILVHEIKVTACMNIMSACMEIGKASMNTVAPFANKLSTEAGNLLSCFSCTLPCVPSLDSQ